MGLRQLQSLPRLVDTYRNLDPNVPTLSHKHITPHFHSKLKPLSPSKTCRTSFQHDWPSESPWPKTLPCVHRWLSYKLSSIHWCKLWKRITADGVKLRKTFSNGIPHPPKRVPPVLLETSRGGDAWWSYSWSNESFLTHIQHLTFQWYDSLESATVVKFYSNTNSNNSNNNSKSLGN